MMGHTGGKRTKSKPVAMAMVDSTVSVVEKACFGMSKRVTAWYRKWSALEQKCHPKGTGEEEEEEEEEEDA